MKPKFDLVECGLCLIGATVMVSQMAVRIPSNHSSAVSGRVETAQVA